MRQPERDLAAVLEVGEPVAFGQGEQPVGAGRVVVSDRDRSAVAAVADVVVGYPVGVLPRVDTAGRVGPEVLRAEVGARGRRDP